MKEEVTLGASVDDAGVIHWWEIRGDREQKHSSTEVFPTPEEERAMAYDMLAWILANNQQRYEDENRMLPHEMQH